MKYFKNKNTKKIIWLTLFFIVYVLLITRFGKYIYGSMLDWNCQHYYIPDYFRKLFYETKNIFPSFAFNLGAGENIYNLSYYGFLSPVIMISYLLPFIPMKLYIQISSIILMYVSVILFYKWISNKVSPKISTVSTILFLLASPLLFHSHRHIMFVNYMPFLMMGLIGVDKYFLNRKKSLLMISTFLICMTSYFFSVGALIAIVMYGAYVYIKLNKKIEVKTFVKDGFKFIYPILIGVLSACVLLLPTFIALLNGRGESSVKTELLSLIIPNIKTNYILYNTYSLGLTSISLFCLVYSIIKLKDEKRLLGIVLSLFVTFSIFVFILNAGMYLNAKVLIPFLPLYILLMALVFENLIKEKSISSFIVFVIIGIYILIFKEKNIYFAVDFILTIIGLIFIMFKKDKKCSNYIFYSLIILTFLSSNIALNLSDGMVLKDQCYDLKSSSELLESIDDTSFYRVSNRNGGLGSANDVININQYKNSIYSSVSNQDYQNFYYNLIGNDVLNRSKGQLSDPKNLLFNTYMSNKYLITSNKIDENGYTLLKSIDGNNLYVNERVLPLGYSTSNIMGLDEYKKLKYPYNVEAIIKNVIVDLPVKGSQYKSDIMEKEFNYSVEKASNITITNNEDYIEIISEDKGNMILNLNEDVKDKLLLIQFELLDSNSCSVGDNSISINNVVNKLTCRSWKYHNKNNQFEYTISDRNINKLNIEFSKGTYKIKSIKTYLLDYSKMMNDVKVSPFIIDKEKTKGDIIEGTITSHEPGYFNISIPYDKGFQIYVDNKKIDYEKTDLSFIGFKIEKGKHRVKIMYTSSGLKQSKIISISGIIVIMATVYIEQTFTKKKTKKR